MDRVTHRHARPLAALVDPVEPAMTRQEAAYRLTQAIAESSESNCIKIREFVQELAALGVPRNVIIDNVKAISSEFFVIHEREEHDWQGSCC